MKKIALLLLCLNLFSTKACALSFTQLQLLLQKNSKQLELKKYDIDISKEDMNIINSENYPTLTSGFNIEDSKSLNQNSNTSVGDNNLVTDSLKKSYAYLSLNYNLYSFNLFNYLLHTFFEALIVPSLHINFLSTVQCLMPPFFPEQGCLPLPAKTG